MKNDAEITILEIIAILKDTDKRVNDLYKNSSFEKPVKNDLAISMQVMAYNEIMALIKKYVKLKREKK